MAHLFRLREHNFQNVSGDELTDMENMSSDGWEIEASTIGFPYVHVLWRKLVEGAEKAKEAEHTACTEAQAALTKERDDAREIARRLKAELDQLKEATPPPAPSVAPPAPQLEAPEE